jgi:GTP-binding protein
MVYPAPHQAAQTQPGTNLIIQTPEERAAAIEAGRLLFAAECQFFHGAQKLEQLPLPGLPEVAFAGRTKQLNFFDLGARLTLVDMPGYGYAQAAKDVKADWQGMMFDYLRGRPTLRRVLLLLDSRIEFKPSDGAVMDLLDQAAVTFVLVLTKADSVKPGALERKTAATAEIARTHAAAYPEVFVTSSESGFGIAELRAELASLAV